MFWKKNNDGVELSVRRVVTEGLIFLTTRTFLAYKQGNEWRGLVGYEQFREEVDSLNKGITRLEKINQLLLEHLGVNFVPEGESKTPAKLQKNIFTVAGSTMEYDNILTGNPAFNGGSGSAGTNTALTNKELSKKKMGRPKKSK